jgi:hypothetical protein
MLRLLRANRVDLGIAASDAELEATLNRTLAQLEGHAATVALADAGVAGDLLTINVEVENQAGHKFPTGFPSRRAWLHLTVTDGAGAVVFESGRPEDDGSIAGNNANTDPLAFEPHHDLITASGQVQIYQAITQDSTGQVTHTLLRAAGYAKDNRLLPVGFDKSTADADIAPQGLAVGDDDFVGGSDRVAYAIDVTGRAGPFTVTAEFLYQSVADEFVHDMAGNDSEAVVQFVDLFNGADRSPVIVSSAETIVP